MKTKILLIVGLMVFTQSFIDVQGQRWPSEFWNEGTVVTVEGDTLKGKLQYDFALNAVKLVIGGKVLVLSNRKLRYFSTFDEFYGLERTFYAIPYTTDTDYKTPLIFEVLYEGPITLLAREFVGEEDANVSMSGFNTGPTFVRVDALKYEYYLLDQLGNINEYSGRRKDLLDLLPDHTAALNRFIRKNRLRTTERADLVRIISFYNAQG